MAALWVVAIFVGMFAFIGAALAHARGHSPWRGALRGLTGFGALLDIASWEERRGSVGSLKSRAPAAPGAPAAVPRASTEDAPLSRVGQSRGPHGQRYPLSSGSTFVFKLLFPLAWATVFGYATVSLWIAPDQLSFNGGPPPPWLKWVMTPIWAGVCVLFGRLFLPLKRLEADDTHLYISNYRRELAVPWADVAAAEIAPSVRAGGIPLARLRLRRETSFGDEVLFLPAGPDALQDFTRRAPPEVRALFGAPSVTTR